MIEINELTKIYGRPALENNVVALRKLSLRIETGEFLGIIGESGSGKSTLLNLIGTFRPVLLIWTAR